MQFTNIMKDKHTYFDNKKIIKLEDTLSGYHVFIFAIRAFWYHILVSIGIGCFCTAGSIARRKKHMWEKSFKMLVHRAYHTVRYDCIIHV